MIIFCIIYALCIVVSSIKANKNPSEHDQRIRSQDKGGLAN